MSNDIGYQKRPYDPRPTSQESPVRHFDFPTIINHKDQNLFKAILEPSLAGSQVISQCFKPWNQTNTGPGNSEICSGQSELFCIKEGIVQRCRTYGRYVGGRVGRSG